MFFYSNKVQLAILILMRNSIASLHEFKSRNFVRDVRYAQHIDKIGKCLAYKNAIFLFKIKQNVSYTIHLYYYCAEEPYSALQTHSSNSLLFRHVFQLRIIWICNNLCYYYCKNWIKFINLYSIQHTTESVLTDIWICTENISKYRKCGDSGRKWSNIKLIRPKQEKFVCVCVL